MKLRFHKGTTDYKKILVGAWRTAWTKKELWLFGLLASAANSGAVFSNTIGTATQLQPADSMGSDVIDNSLEAFPFLVKWITNLVQLNVAQFTGTVVAILVGVVLLTILVVIGQQLLVFGVHKSATSRKHVPVSALKKELKHLHFWRMLATNLLVGLGLLLLLTASSFPLMALLGTNPTYNFVVYAAFYTVILPLAFFLNVMGMLTLIHIVHIDEGLFPAIKRSWHTVKHHWLTLLELAVILFAINLAGSFVGVVLLALVAIVLGFVSFGTLALGSTIALTIVSVLIAIFFVLVLVTFVGFLTTFNYAFWAQVANRMERGGIMPLIEHVRVGLTR